MIESATPEKIGEQNRRLILEYVRKWGPVSRADLHRVLNMSSPAVSANVKRLMDQGYLLEAGDSDGKVGRKATLVRFNARRRHVAGVDIGRSAVRAMLADLMGEERAYLEAPIRVEQIGGQICEMLESLLRETGVNREELGCIALGIPGVWEAETGCVRLAPYFAEFDLAALRGMLEEAFRAEVLVENSVKYGAIGEKWKGVAQGYRDIAYVNYGVGIGAALILNGELYRGARGAAGEIGFMLTDSAQKRNAFEERGALEACVSGNRLRERLLDYGMNADVRSAWSDDPEHARQALDDLIEAVGAMLVNVTAVFNEEIIVLGGGLGDALGACCIPIWREMLENHVPYVPELTRSGLRERANVLGAVAAAMRFVNDEALDCGAEV